MGGLGEADQAVDRFGEFRGAARPVAHLAGALGRPVWLMLKYAPDWRWGYVGKTSPWYDSMRLFRQARPGDWSSPFAQAAESLAALTRGAS